MSDKNKNFVFDFIYKSNEADELVDSDLLASYAISTNSGNQDSIYENSPIIPSGGAIYDYMSNKLGDNIVYTDRYQEISAPKDFLSGINIYDSSKKGGRIWSQETSYSDGSTTSKDNPIYIRTSGTPLIIGSNGVSLGSYEATGSFSRDSISGDAFSYTIPVGGAISLGIRLNDYTVTGRWNFAAGRIDSFKYGFNTKAEDEKINYSEISSDSITNSTTTVKVIAQGSDNGIIRTPTGIYIYNNKEENSYISLKLDDANSYAINSASSKTDSIVSKSQVIPSGGAIYDFVKENDTSILNQAKEYTNSVATGALIWKGVTTFEKLPEDPRVGDFWTISDKNNSEYAWNGESWYDIGTITDLSELSNKIDALEEKIPDPFDDSNVVHKTGDESISGVKTFAEHTTRFYSNTYLSSDIEDVTIGLSEKQEDSSGDIVTAWGPTININWNSRDSDSGEDEVYFGLNYLDRDFVFNNNSKDYTKSIIKNSNLIPTGHTVWSYLNNYDSNVVHKTGAEEISGNKKFYDNVSFGLDTSHTKDSTGYGDSETAGRAWLCCRRAYKSSDSSLYYDKAVNANRSNSSKMTELTIGIGGYGHQGGGSINMYSWEDDNEPTDYPEEAGTRFAFLKAKKNVGGAEWVIWLTKDSNEKDAIANGSNKLITGNAVWNYMNNANLVHTTENESISGFKRFYDTLSVSNNGIIIGFEPTNYTKGNATIKAINDDTTGDKSSNLEIEKQGYNGRKNLYLKLKSSREEDDSSDKFEFSGDNGEGILFTKIISNDSSNSSSINKDSNVLIDGGAVYNYVEEKLKGNGNLWEKLDDIDPSTQLENGHFYIKKAGVADLRSRTLPYITGTETCVVIYNTYTSSISVRSEAPMHTGTFNVSPGEMVFFYANFDSTDGAGWYWAAKKIATTELSIVAD